MMAQSIIENVIKQGYLKRGHYGASRLSLLFRRTDVNKWFVFTIRQGIPLLEYYDSDVDVFKQQPINSFNLSQCQGVRGMASTNPPSFCIVCPDRIIELVASSRAQMLEWVNEIEASLIRLGILQHDAADHVYSVCPAVIRKPRVSRQGTEETSPEAASSSLLPETTANLESRRSVEADQTVPNPAMVSAPPPRPSALTQRNIALKPSPRASLPGLPPSFHASFHSSSADDTGPPPLPARSASYKDQERAARSESHRSAGSTSSHPAADGSNDSDFVSAEVIAELRLQRHNSQTAPALASQENMESADVTGMESTNLTWMESTDLTQVKSAGLTQMESAGLTQMKSADLTGMESADLTGMESAGLTGMESAGLTQMESSSDLYMDMGKSQHGNNNKPADGNHCLHLQSPFKSLTMTNNHDVPTASSTLETHPKGSVPSQCGQSQTHGLENTYSVFPCQPRASGDVIGHNSVLDLDVSATAKPTPFPRKTMSKTSSAVCDLASIGLFHGTDSTPVPTLGTDSTHVPTHGTDSTLVPTHGTDSTFVPTHGTDSTFVPTHGTDSTLVLTHGTDSTLVPTHGTDSTFVPTLGTDSTLVPTSGTDSTLVPTSGTDSTLVPTPGTDSTLVATPGTVNHCLAASSDNQELPVYSNLSSATDVPRHLHVSDSCRQDTSSDSVILLAAASTDMVCEYVNCQDEHVTLKSEYSNIHQDHLSHSVKDIRSHPSKDENENVYGLVFDVGPPTTTAPLPPVLAPDQCSQSVWCHSHQCSTGQERRTGANSLPSSTSAFLAAAAAGNKHHSLPTQPCLPPLPLPRKTNSHSGTSLGSRAVTDLLGKDTPHTISKVQQQEEEDEDLPPALPSRNCQSFFIKRPQITGLPGHQTTDSQASKQAVAMLAPPTSSGHNSRMETGTEVSAASICSLSRKMLLDPAHSLHTVVSLKQTQADILQTEISMPSLAVVITHKAGHGLALVDWSSFACVVGWDQKTFPSLHSKLHVGDLIVSVNGVRVTSAETADKLLKQATSPSIELRLHRMPYAKVFAIHRRAEGQSLGIKRNGGTGEIVYVDPNGLAAQHGLTQHALSVSGHGRCNWFLVEINNRPLSLFFKENEIEHRLSAVGRDISIVVQPSDFIEEIRRQFKKLKNYKQFIAL